jgi:hypothetical protein
MQKILKFVKTKHHHYLLLISQKIPINDDMAARLHDVFSHLE